MRMHIEAHLDFPDEEIDRQQIAQLSMQLTALDNFLDVNSKLLRTFLIKKNI